MRLHIAQQGWEHARLCLQALLPDPAHAIPALLLLGSICLATGSVRRAVAHLQQAAASLPDDMQRLAVSPKRARVSAKLTLPTPA